MGNAGKALLPSATWHRFLSSCLLALAMIRFLGIRLFCVAITTSVFLGCVVPSFLDDVQRIKRRFEALDFLVGELVKEDRRNDLEAGERGLEIRLEEILYLTKSIVDFSRPLEESFREEVDLKLHLTIRKLGMIRNKDVRDVVKRIDSLLRT